jgi:hypothetical protein
LLIENKTLDVTLELSKIKEYASDLQTFLSLPQLVSKASNEEIDVEKVGSEGKFNRKSIIFTARIDDIIQMKSIGDVDVDDVKSDVTYVKEKEKQAQIVGLLTRRTSSFILLSSNVTSSVLFSISVKLFFTLPNCKVTSSTVLFILPINVSCN